MEDKNILLSSYGNWADESSKVQYRDNLESFILKCNKSISRGKDLVSDSVYSTLVDYLRELDSNSPLLHTMWCVNKGSVDFSEELDNMLEVHPILSKPLVSNVKDDSVGRFKEKLYNYPVEVMCALDLKGYPIRVVYKDGVIVKATIKGSSAKGKDITRQVILILGKKNNSLRGRGLVELRGTITLSYSNLDKVKEVYDGVSTVRSGVSSLIKEDVSDKEVKLLNIVFSDILGDMFMFDSLTDKYQFIERIGFDTPLAFVGNVEKYSFEDDVLRLVGKMEGYAADYTYPTSGIVLSIDDLDLYSKFGVTDKYSLGSLYLKMGEWKQDSYRGIIKEIKWLDSVSKKIPVAILEEGVVIEGGITINSVPLYAPCYILMLEAYVGRSIYFRYGGDIGALPSNKDGKILIDKTKNE